MRADDGLEFLSSCSGLCGVGWGGGYKIAATATECLTLGDSVAGALHLKVRLAGASSQPLRFESREGDIGESQRGGILLFRLRIPVVDVKNPA